MLRLKAERLKRGWERETLASRAHISIVDLSRMECGWVRPHPPEVRRHMVALARLAAVLGILPPEALLEDVGEQGAGQTENETP